METFDKEGIALSSLNMVKHGLHVCLAVMLAVCFRRGEAGLSSISWLKLRKAQPSTLVMSALLSSIASYWLSGKQYVN